MQPSLQVGGAAYLPTLPPPWVEGSPPCAIVCVTMTWLLQLMFIIYDHIYCEFISCMKAEVKYEVYNKYFIVFDAENIKSFKIFPSF